jgi:hypothetical protein
MAFKFQLGEARMSGSLVQDGGFEVRDDDDTLRLQVARDNGNVSGSGTAAFASSLTVASGLASISAAGAGSLGGCNMNSGGITSAGSIAGATTVAMGGALTGVTTLAASGLASVASISMDDGSTLGPDSVAGLWTFSAAGDTTQANGAYDFDLASHDGTNGLKLGGTLVTSTAAQINTTNVTAGAATASKAVVLDASKNIATIGTVGCGAITSTGASSFGASTLASLTCTAAGTFGGGIGASGATITTDGAISADGRIITDDTTAATSTTDGSLQTDGGLSVVLDAVIGDDVFLLSDAAVLNFGADSDVKLTHVADTGLLLNSTMAIQFNDSSQYIKASSGADLDIAATTDINVECTTLDVNAAMSVSGLALFEGAVTLGNATSDDLTFTGYAASDIVPKTDSTYNLGTTALRWGTIYVDAIVGADVAFDVEAVGPGDTIASATDYALVTGSQIGTVTLPTAVAGKRMYIKLGNACANMTIAPGGSDAFPEVTGSLVLESTGSAVTLVALDATNWYIQ